MRRKNNRYFFRGSILINKVIIQYRKNICTIFFPPCTKHDACIKLINYIVLESTSYVSEWIWKNRVDIYFYLNDDFADALR